MLLIFATIAVLGVLLLFIWDTSRDQETNSNIFSYYTPFYAESIVRHSYVSSPESVWKSLTDLSAYQSWFPNINRLLPNVDTDRYVHQFSFNKFSLLPGAEFLLRPYTWSPFYKSKVVVVDENAQISFDLKTNPFYREYVDFSLKAEPYGTSVICRRSSRGLFSVFSLWGFSSAKHKVLENLGYFIPVDFQEKDDVSVEKDVVSDKSKKTSATDSGFSSQSDHVAYLVNLALDGNDEPLNAVDNKVIRGKAKAMIIKIKRGALDRPTMPASSSAPGATPRSPNETRARDSGF